MWSEPGNMCNFEIVFIKNYNPVQPELDAESKQSPILCAHFNSMKL